MFAFSSVFILLLLFGLLFVYEDTLIEPSHLLEYLQYFSVYEDTPWTGQIFDQRQSGPVLQKYIFERYTSSSYNFSKVLLVSIVAGDKRCHTSYSYSLNHF